MIPMKSLSFLPWFPSNPALLVSLFLAVAPMGCQRNTDEHSAHTVPPLQSVFIEDGTTRPLIFAHRGGPVAGFPENAIETFNHTFNKTGAFMEVDPRYTRDGDIVLFHDQYLERCSTGSGQMAEHTLTELKQLRLLDKTGKETEFSIPTLEEAMQWAKGKSVLLLDRKDVSVEERVKAIQRQDAYSHAMVSAYNYEEAKRIYQMDPRIMMQVFMPDLEAMVRFETSGVPWKNVIASVSKVPLTPKHYVLIEKIHEKGTMVVVASYQMLDHPYLAGNISEEAFVAGYQALIDAGVDIIQCDLPIEVSRIRLGKNL